MRKITRCELPESLRKHSSNWTQLLMNEINNKGNYNKVEEQFKNKYNQKDIKLALKKMNKSFCSYCESRIDPANNYGHIEHHKPKSKFPQLCFSWDNLHLCCEVCNIIKSDKWDDINPLIDPCLDNPEEHLTYAGSYITPETDRGITTIEHIELNRNSLLLARMKIFNEVIKLMKQAGKIDNNLIKHHIKQELQILVNEESEYSSLAKSTFNEFSSFYGL